jgi:tetratricopeptide (TPR) repeat protein
LIIIGDISHMKGSLLVRRRMPWCTLTDIVADEANKQALSILQEISTQLPRASAPRRLALTVAVGDDFKDHVRPYLLSGLTKGIPSLFSDIKALYRDDEKRKMVENIVESALAEFASNQSASADPTNHLWTLYFLAQHYSYLSRPTQALEIVDQALAHTPTLPELLTCKGRILKRAGDLLGAARYVNEARLLDGQDRFLNTKCAKYLLRAGLIEEASTILGLFTKVTSLIFGMVYF